MEHVRKRKKAPFKAADHGEELHTAGRIPGGGRWGQDGRAGAFRAALNEIVANTPVTPDAVVKASKRGDT